MKYINRIFFSVGAMAFWILIFLVALIIGTWLENDFGTQTAKLYVYNAKWLEVVMVLIIVNLIINIFRYNMFRREKASALAFHLSFIIILLGAGVTRYFGFEGIMPIGEGEARGFMHSAEAYIQLNAHDKENMYKYEKPILVSPLSSNSFSNSFELPGHEEVNLEVVEYIPKAVDSVFEDDSFNTIVELVVPNPEGGMKSVYMQTGQIYSENGLKITLDNDSIPDAIKLNVNGNQVSINSPYDISFLKMADQSRGMIKKDSVQTLNQRQLNQVNGQSFVYKRIFESASLKKISLGVKSEKGVDALKVKLTQGDKTKELYLTGGEKRIPDPKIFEFNGINYRMAYGAKILKLPFLVGLRDFKLERYPGTDSPASFSSDVVVQDSTRAKDFNYKIYMNHVLDYRGYRFFQSSYMPDEKGTILSVNHDWWGTNITYLGYLLMSLGMVLSIFMKGSRIRELFSNTKKIKSSAKITATILAFLVSSSLFSQETLVDKEHAERFGKVISLSPEGRLMPMHTIALDVLRKLHRSDKFINSKGQEMTPLQVYLEMQLDGKPWLDERIIIVNNSDFRKEFDFPQKYATMHEFYDNSDGHAHYKLEKLVKIANRKSDKDKGKRDKEIIKINDRYQVLNMALTGFYTQIYPIESDSSDHWFAPYDAKFRYQDKDSTYPILQYLKYLAHLKKAKYHGNYDTCNVILDEIIATQERVAGDVMPSKTKVKYEIMYNKSNVFKRSYQLYMSLGAILLIVLFVNVFLPSRPGTEKTIRIFSNIFSVLIFLVFLCHGIGLGVRWYVSGHAPWSNGFEALVFIAFILVLAGFIFSKWSKIILACAAFLASLMLFVAHMNIMDPAISNLVPVLNSYWLMIHVAIITSSYAFLGLGCILGILNMFIDIARKKNASKKLKDTYKILTNVNEVTVSIGLFTLSIGTFLGGIWANESWGRYWGWDAKETWAFISMLVYSIILHFRFIPGLKGKSTFNFATSIGYLSIIFTFFGVNYLLSGLHSYAKGDPVPIPQWIYYAVAIVIGLGIRAMISEKKRKKKVS